MNLIKEIRNKQTELENIRREIHSHPEIAMTEYKTAALIADKLEQNGIEVHRNIGHTGVVGIINGELDGPSIALRADMDALPMDEESDKSYRSTVAGQSHTCGHDGHATMLLAASLYLAKNKPKRGRIVLIFQPAEETGEGALKMMEDGLLDKFPFEEIYGCHNMPLLGIGRAGMTAGPTLSSYADFDIEINGLGSHAGSQYSSIDPIQVAARLVTELSSLVSRYIDSKESATVAVGTINSGTARNIIPEQAIITGTIRCLSKDIQNLLINKIKDICSGFNTAYGCQAKLIIESFGIPCVNDAAAIDVAYQACCKTLGEDNVDKNISAYPFADDHAFFQDKIPGAYYFVGQDGDMVHTTHYDFDDRLLPIGATIFANIIDAKLGLTQEILSS